MAQIVVESRGKEMGEGHKRMKRNGKEEDADGGERVVT